MAVSDLPIIDIPINRLDGTATTLRELAAGNAMLLVNVASKCGLTPQYTGLEALQKELGPRGFTVIGLPCNQFGGQEPGTAEEIETFCSTTYGVTFPMTEKIEVNGSGQHPVYTELTAVPDADGTAGDIQWNFEKFVLAADGTILGRFRPRTEPHDPALLATIDKAL
jgi:glutathione peroxidase